MVTMPMAFVVGKFADRYGYRQFIIAGCLTAFLAMLTAAFSTQLWQFFLTQGVLQGACIGLILPVAMSFPAQWFRCRRGLATGIVIAGSSFGGGAGSLMAQQLLNRLGLRYTLIFYSFYHLFLMTLAVFMLQDRPHPHSARFTKAPIQWWDSTLFRKPLFWSVAIATLFVVFGYLPPYFYIQLYTMEKLPDLNPALYAVPAAVMNFSAAAGRTAIGLLADRIGVVNAFFVSVLISGCMQLLFWNFATSFPAIICFSILVGFFGAAFLSMTSVIGAKLFGVQNLATLSGILLLFNMPGNAAGSPLAGAIFSASGGNWHAAITFSGMCSVVGAFCILYARFKMEPRVFAIY
ncbi:MFS general substrate transporter [Dacryopinax primogenitus]|uniref:MFS general substrate transporter n=1 Tax=Dacryopinax primogenitus (strain DJM 731) TaxID=1858805 RepID=M5G1K4_DACPD|nr:MFS general substrate transporter [Dacryopinax primogenitus]EJT99721.1 MFS general substrate transporter [Dacryopinax primogenitus]